MPLSVNEPEQERQRFGSLGTYQTLTTSSNSQPRDKFNTKGATRLKPADETPLLPVVNEIFPDQGWSTRRHYENVHNRESMNEWDINTTNDRGLCTYWGGIHRKTLTSFDYNSVKYRHRVVNEQRNRLPELSRGDKAYFTPEYSSGFHKHGSTRPLPNFGGRNLIRTDTNIPLVEISLRRVSYSEKERSRILRENTQLVEELSSWRPATPLVARPSKAQLRVQHEPQTAE